MNKSVTAANTVGTLEIQQRSLVVGADESQNPTSRGSEDIFGTHRALTGLETEVFCGRSRSLVVTRGYTKALVNKGFWVNFLRTPNGV